jgi:phosphoglycerate dehydrogenase-like enzyme
LSGSEAMKIVLLGRMACVAPGLLREGLESGHDLEIEPSVSFASGRPDIFADAQIIVGGPITREIAAAARGLRLFHAAQAGIDGLGLEWLGPAVQVCNTYNHEVSIAEHVLLAMLTLLRRPQEFDRELRQGKWDGSCIWGRPPELGVLQGRTALIIGLGHIAREIVLRAGAFGLRIVGVSRRPEPRPGVDVVVGYETWRDQLPRADFLIPCCPLTAETRGLIGARELESLNRGARLINIARAGIVDEAALYEALRQGRLAGAALDVWYQYPKTRDEICHPSRFPFHELPNVLLTPHVSGWTTQTVAGRMRDIAGNINRLSRGEPLKNVVRRATVAG